MDEPIWVSKRDALAIHGMQLGEHGGLTGIRDDALLASALARPSNLFACGHPICATWLPPTRTASPGIIPPFADGNKRTSLGVCLAFLDVNGLDLPADDGATIAIWQALAAGEVGEPDLAAWLRARIMRTG